ncbi:MAG: molybdopterin-synthase adenylyltransferase MoeB [Albidovulum sp.]|nr:molybdopterin-synthase adenylyltransferase MoeB [Albidovulum sp.]MDE0533996.1 molybdopterin-synthase adenylyltransferase MoeB [Albidovulum sp.]
MKAKTGSFYPEELERYARHISLREIGGAGQRKLKNSSVLVVGAGGLGSPALLYLAASGVGTLGIADDDDVSVANLQRQIIHASDRLGTPKTTSAEMSIGSLNPFVNVESHRVRFAESNATELLRGYEIVLDGSDNFDTRYLVNKACADARLPLVSGAIGQWEGQVSVFDPARGAPCYACVFPERPAEGLAPSCAEAGVVGALPGVVGAIMAMEATKLITGAGECLTGRMLIYDALWCESRIVNVARDPNCPVCGAIEPVVRSAALDAAT